MSRMKKELTTLCISNTVKLPNRVDRPDQRAPFWEIWKVPAAGRLRAVIVSDYLFSCNTHFVHDHTRPCTLDWTGRCAHCADVERHYAAFLAAWSTQSRAVRLLALTAGAVRSCPALEGERPLAGRQVEVWRVRPSRNGPQRAALSDDLLSIVPPEKVIPVAAVRQCVLNLWGVRIKVEVAAGASAEAPAGIESPRAARREVQDVGESYQW